MECFAVHQAAMPRVILLASTTLALLAAGCVAQPDESRPEVPSPALPACASTIVNVQWEDAEAATATNLSAAFEDAGYAWNETQPGVAELRGAGANVTTRLALPANATASGGLTLTVRGAAGDSSEDEVLAEASRIAEVVNGTAPDARLRQWLVDATDAGCGVAGAGERDAGFDATSDR